jgi:hypothetical protein
MIHSQQVNKAKHHPPSLEKETRFANRKDSLSFPLQTYTPKAYIPMQFDGRLPTLILEILSGDNAIMGKEIMNIY